MFKNAKLSFPLIVALLWSINLFALENSVHPKHPIVVCQTTAGTFELELFPEVAPKACENFLKHAEDHYYDKTVFHRVIKGFMIQGGDPQGLGIGGQSIWGKSFPDEVAQGVGFDSPGLLAMANRGPNTNGSQFFITTAQTPWLHMKHTIFGRVCAGYDVVQKIENMPTDGRDRPTPLPQILSMTVKN